MTYICIKVVLHDIAGRGDKRLHLDREWDGRNMHVGYRSGQVVNSTKGCLRLFSTGDSPKGFALVYQLQSQYSRLLYLTTLQYTCISTTYTYGMQALMFTYIQNS